MNIEDAAELWRIETLYRHVVLDSELSNTSCRDFDNRL